jgi:hypothetical protein
LTCPSGQNAKTAVSRKGQYISRSLWGARQADGIAVLVLNYKVEEDELVNKKRLD